MKHQKLNILFLLVFIFSTSILSAQLKLKKSEIENIKAYSKAYNDGSREYFFMLEGKKIGPTIRTGNGLHCSFYDKKGRKHGAQMYNMGDNYSVNLYKKDRKRGNGFKMEAKGLIYAREYYNSNEDYYDIGNPFKNKEVREEECVGNCENGFGYTRYKSSKTEVLGFFRKYYPEGAVYVRNPRGKYFGSFKKGYRHGNGILITKKDFRHASFKKGEIMGLELYYNVNRNNMEAYYRDKKGDIIKRYKFYLYRQS